MELTQAPDPMDPQSRIFTLNHGDNAPFRLDCIEDGGTHEQHSVAMRGARERIVRLRGLKADATYVCRAYRTDGKLRGESNEVRFTTDPLPDDLILPKLTIPPESLSATGYTLYNQGNFYYDGDMEHFDVDALRSDDNYLVIVDAEGNVRWWYKGIGAGDFEARYLGHERILFTGQATDMAHPPTIVGLDKRTRILGHQIPSVDYELGDEAGLYYNHEGALAPDGQSIFTLVHTLNPEDDTTLGFVVKELPLTDADEDDIMDNTLWYWDSFEAAAEGEFDHINATYGSDPVHANSISVDEADDGTWSVYVSLRNASRIIKIDYLSKHVVWSMGYDREDFRLLENDGRPAAIERWFFDQHDVQVHGDTITMHDNGTDRLLVGGDAYTRALELEVDEDAGVVRIVSEYTEKGWNEPFWGGHDVLSNGHRLIAMGHCGFCGLSDDFRSAVLELDGGNRPVWRLDFPEPAADLMIYRAQRIDGCAIFNNLDYCDTVHEYDPKTLSDDFEIDD